MRRVRRTALRKRGCCAAPCGRLLRRSSQAGAVRGQRRCSARQRSSHDHGVRAAAVCGGARGCARRTAERRQRLGPLISEKAEDGCRNVRRRRARFVCRPALLVRRALLGRRRALHGKMDCLHGPLKAAPAAAHHAAAPIIDRKFWCLYRRAQAMQPCSAARERHRRGPARGGFPATRQAPGGQRAYEQPASFIACCSCVTA